MGRVWDKLRKRLKDELDLECDEKFVRTYAGFWQRKAGAWSWESPLLGKVVSVGSQWSMTKLLKSPKLVKYKASWGIDYDIIPEDG